MLENLNAIVVVEVGRSKDVNAMGRERETQRIRQQSEGPTRDSSIKRSSRQSLRTSQLKK